MSLKNAIKTNNYWRYWPRNLENAYFTWTVLQADLKKVQVTCKANIVFHASIFCSLPHAVLKTKVIRLLKLLWQHTKTLKTEISHGHNLSGADVFNKNGYFPLSLMRERSAPLFALSTKSAFCNRLKNAPTLSKMSQKLALLLSSKKRRSVNPLLVWCVYYF